MSAERIRFVIVTIATLAGMTLTASLGRWQLNRAAEKEALQAAIDERGRAPAMDVRSAVGSAADESLLHRRVKARGTWLTEHTVFLDNRQMNGRVGFYVVTPLKLEGSENAVILVQRGWAPRDFQDRLHEPEVATPVGAVTIEGRLAPPPTRLYDMGEAGTGRIRQNIDLAAFRIETSLPLVWFSIQQDGDAPDGLLRAWPPVNTGVSKHYGYAFQWFGLCALMALLYVWFQIIRRR